MYSANGRYGLKRDITIKAAINSKVANTFLALNARYAADAIKNAAAANRHVVLTGWFETELAGVLLGSSPEGGVATIIWLMVDRRYQRRGFGSTLFKYACRLYREMGCHKIKLTVSQKNTIRFYEIQGMQVEGFHKNHWWKMDMWSLGKIL